MAIDAIIDAVTVISADNCSVCHGTGKDPETNWDECPSCHGGTKENPRVRIKLIPRDPNGVAGQTVLTITNPPTTDINSLSSLIGVHIWGNSSDLMIGSKVWAKRIGYTKIELL